MQLYMDSFAGGGVSNLGSLVRYNYIIRSYIGQSHGDKLLSAVGHR